MIVIKKKATEILTAHYSGTFHAHGSNSEGVDWGSTEKHHLRLQSMVRQVGAQEMGHQSVLDVGCGYGELLNVLLNIFRIRPAQYVGIDPCLPMIEAARIAYPGYQFEAHAFETFVPERQVEHLFCCGVFTKKTDAKEEEMYALLDAFLDYGKKIGARTITFNTMSPLCDIRTSDLFFPEVDHIVRVFRKQWGYAARKFSFSSDYLQYEMLVHIEV